MHRLPPADHRASRCRRGSLPRAFFGTSSGALVLCAWWAASYPQPSLAAAMSTEASRLDATESLQSYLRLDTSNPPGNETAAVEFLHRLLSEHAPGALRTTRFVSPGGRMSLLARLPATVQEPEAPLVLVHHLDVVPTPHEELWSHPPFAGVVEEGRIWGRGAVDSKGLGVAHLSALLAAARQPVRSRDVVLLAVADEEAGGHEGAGWLLERFDDLIEPRSLVLGEGGVNRVQQGTLVWWGLEKAQKRPLWIRVTYRGTGGHGSTAGGNPLDKLLRGLTDLTQLRRPARLTRPLWEHLSVAAPIASSPYAKRFAEDFAEALQVWKELEVNGERYRWIPPGYRSVLRDTIQINSVQAISPVANMKPAEASAVLDARLLPDTDPRQFLDQLLALFEPGFVLETLLEANESALEVEVAHPDLYRVEAVLRSTAPVVPAMISGTTDSRWFRDRGIAAYGFSPFALEREDTDGIHAVDESIGVSVFEEGVETMVDVVLALVEPAAKGAPSSGG